MWKWLSRSVVRALRDGESASLLSRRQAASGLANGSVWSGGATVRVVCWQTQGWDISVLFRAGNLDPHDHREVALRAIVKGPADCPVSEICDGCRRLKNRGQAAYRQIQIW